MKWFSNLLRKPEATPSPTPIHAPKAAPDRNDIEALRSQFAGSADDVRIATRLGRALAELNQPPRPDDPADVHIAAICHVQDKALAHDWLARLQTDAALGTVATQARSGETRFAAAQRIESDEVLDRVAQASRDKDKRVHRHCAERLRQRRAAQADARRAGEIADQLRALLDMAPQSLSRLMELKKALGELATDVAATECAALLDTAFTRLRTETEAQRQLHAHQEAATRLEAECAQAHWPWTAQFPDWLSRLEALKRDAADQPAWLAPQARSLAAILAGIDSRLADMAGDDAARAACERFLDALEAEHPAEPEARAQWRALAKPRHADAHRALEERWQSLSARLYPPRAAPDEPKPAPAAEPAPRAAPKLDLTALRALLDSLEQAIGAGHLADADAAARQIKALIAGKEPRGALESRWHGLQAELETLRGWARWGNQQAREKLIADAEALLTGEHPVDELAETIPALREAWKQLNAHAPADKTQWEVFDATLEKAYAPVAARRAEQAARQAEARALKEALCAQWEAETDWRQADFKQVEARRTDMIQQWRAAPQAGFRDERALRKRFDALIEAVDRHLDEARAAEMARREQLILAAEALAGEADTRRATTEAKALQQSWSKQGTAVRLKRGDEQKLWQRFRAACDVVFARVDAQRAEQAARRAEQAEVRRRHLDEFAAALSGTDASEIQRAMTRFQSELEAARPAGRERGEHPADALETEARALLDQARQRIEALRLSKRMARYDLLARKSDLAARVESAALAGQPIEAVVAEVQEAWAALPVLPGAGERLLAQRLADAGTVTAERMAAGQETRESLLLDLEIALGLPSPDSRAEMRRERQLARLQDRFATTAAQAAEPEDMLARWYATPAPADPAALPRIAAVVQHLAARTARA